MTPAYLVVMKLQIGTLSMGGTQSCAMGWPLRHWTKEIIGYLWLILTATTGYSTMETSLSARKTAKVRLLNDFWHGIDCTTLTSHPTRVGNRMEWSKS